MSPNSSNTGSTSAKKTKLCFITNVSADFWAYAEAGAKQAETEFGDIEVYFRAGDGTTTKQKQIVDDLLVTGVKGIAISPTSAKNQIRMPYPASCFWGALTWMYVVKTFRTGAGLIFSIWHRTRRG